MKNILLLLFLISTSTLAVCQDYPIEDGRIVYELIVKNENASKEDLFAASKRFIANTFTSASAVIQVEDAATGEIIGKGRSAFTIPTKGMFGYGYNYKFTIQLNSKDGRGRIRIYDISDYKKSSIGELDTPLEEFDIAQKMRAGDKPKRIKSYNELKNHINEHFLTFLVLYKREIEKVGISSDDW